MNMDSVRQTQQYTYGDVENIFRSCSRDNPTQNENDTQRINFVYDVETSSEKIKKEEERMILDILTKSMIDSVFENHCARRLTSRGLAIDSISPSAQQIFLQSCEPQSLQSKGCRRYDGTLTVSYSETNSATNIDNDVLILKTIATDMENDEYLPLMNFALQDKFSVRVQKLQFEGPDLSLKQTGFEQSSNTENYGLSTFGKVSLPILTVLFVGMVSFAFLMHRSKSKEDKKEDNKETSTVESEGAEPEHESSILGCSLYTIEERKSENDKDEIVDSTKTEKPISTMEILRELSNSVSSKIENNFKSSNVTSGTRIDFAACLVVPFAEGVKTFESCYEKDDSDSSVETYSSSKAWSAASSTWRQQVSELEAIEKSFEPESADDYPSSTCEQLIAEVDHIERSSEPDDSDGYTSSTCKQHIAEVNPNENSSEPERTNGYPSDEETQGDKNEKGGIDTTVAKKKTIIDGTGYVRSALEL